MSKLTPRWSANDNPQSKARQEMTHRDNLLSILDRFGCTWFGSQTDPRCGWLYLSDGRIHKVAIDGFCDPILLLYSQNINGSRGATWTGVELLVPDDFKPGYLDEKTGCTIVEMTKDFKVDFTTKYPLGLYGMFMPPTNMNDTSLEIKQPAIIQVFGEMNRIWVGVVLSNINP